MARNVGDIEVTVNAETGKLQAQVVKGALKAGRKGGEALEEGISEGFDSRKILAELEYLAARAEQTLNEVGLDVRLQDEEVYADLRELRARAEAKALGIDVELLDEEFNARVEKATRDREVEFKAELVDSLFKAELEAIENEQLEITATLEDELLRLEMAELREKIEANAIDIDVELDLDQADVNQLRLYRQIQEANAINVPVKIDLDEASAARAAKVFDGFGNGLQGRTQAIAFAVVGLLEPAFVALEGLAAATTAVLSSGFNALLSGAAALAPIFAGLAGTTTALVVGFNGLGDAFGGVNEIWAEANKLGQELDTTSQEFQDTLAGLTPEAAGLVEAFADLTPELSRVQDLVQSRLFRGLAQDLTDLGKNKIPDVSNALVAAAESANRFGRDFFDVLESIDFTELFDKLQPAVDGVLRGVINLARTLEPFLLAAAPAANQLADAFERGTGNLNQFVAADTEGLSSFLTEGVTSLEKWFDLLGSIGGVLGTIFAAGQSSGDGFVETLTEIIDRFDAFLLSAEGQDALSNFFETGERAISALTPVLEGLREAFSILVTEETIGRFENLGEAIGNALPVAATLFEIFGQAELFTVLLNGIAALTEGLLELEPLFSAIASLVAGLDPQLVGAGIAALGVAQAFGKLNSILKLLPGSLAVGLGPIAAISAAVGALTFAFLTLTDDSSDLEDRTNELAGSLEGVAQALRDEATAADAASVGLRSLNDVLLSAGDGGDKLTDVFARLNVNSEDALATILRVQDDPVTALSQLAQSFGLTADAAEVLATEVAESESGYGNMTRGLQTLAEGSNLTTGEVRQLADLLEELQDQSENFDASTVIKQTIETARVSDDAARAAALQAEAINEGGLAAENLLPLWEDYNRFLVENAANEEAATEAALAAAEAQRAREEVLEANALATAELNDKTNRLRDAYSRLTPSISLAIQDFVSLGDNAREAAAAASSVSAAFDLLIGPSIGVDAALDNVFASLAAITAGFAEGTEAGLEYGGGLDRMTEQGRANRESIRSGAEALLAFTEQSLASGESSEVAAQGALAFRDSLIDQTAQFTETRGEAEDYINQLGLTPELLETLITLPGVAEAIQSGEGLLEALEDIPLDVRSTLTLSAQQALDDLTLAVETAEDIDGSKAESEAEVTTNQEDADEFVDTLDYIANSRPRPVLSFVGLAEGTADLEELQGLLDGVDATEPAPAFSYPGLADGIADTEALDTAISGLPDASVTISVPSIENRITEVNRLANAINNLRSRTITVTTQNRNVAASMTGRIVDSPMISTLGERGYREAVVPLELPLSRVNPEVREMAAILRGKSPGGAPPVQSGPSRVVNNNFTIHETDRSETTASRVMNRIAGSLL